MNVVYLDPLDPRGLPEPAPYRVVWIDPDNDVCCIVDEVDYLWAVEWLWGVTPNSTNRKFYATRSTRLSGRSGPQTKLFMHKEILDRSGLTPPSRKHTLGDHYNGDSLDNRRGNLRWATHSINSRNRKKQS